MKRILLLACISMLFCAGCQKEKNQPNQKDVANSYSPYAGKCVSRIEERYDWGTIISNMTYDDTGRIKRVDRERTWFEDGKAVKTEEIYSYGDDYILINNIRCNIDTEGRITDIRDKYTLTYDNNEHLISEQGEELSEKPVKLIWTSDNLIHAERNVYTDIKYTAYENKTNLDFTAAITNAYRAIADKWFWFSAISSDASPASLFGMFGTRSTNLPASESYLGGTVINTFKYKFDDDGCPVEITGDNVTYKVYYK